jgi:hypothetical protein
MALLLKEQPHEVLEDIFTVDSLVYVTCYGPFWGFRGTVCAVDVIPLSNTQEALYFYLIALQEGQIKEPIWFVHDDVAAVEGDNASLWYPTEKEESLLEVETLQCVWARAGSQKTLSIAQEEGVAVL